MDMRLGICVVGCCVLLSACATGTSDPRGGGLFSYNPKAYERRIQERETRLNASAEETRSTQHDQERLQASVAVQERKKAEARQKMDTLHAELDKTRRVLNAVKTRDARMQASLGEMQRRHSELSGQLGRLEKTPDRPGIQLERERLDAEIQRLQREAEALGSL